MFKNQKTTRTMTLNSFVKKIVWEVTIWSKGGKYKCDIRCDFIKTQPCQAHCMWMQSVTASASLPSASYLRLSVSPCLHY